MQGTLSSISNCQARIARILFLRLTNNIPYTICRNIYNLHTKFHVPSLSCLVPIAVNLKDKWKNVRMDAMLLFYIKRVKSYMFF
jgi:hypothetical protein